MNHSGKRNREISFGRELIFRLGPWRQKNGAPAGWVNPSVLTPPTHLPPTHPESPTHPKTIPPPCYPSHVHLCKKAFAYSLMDVVWPFGVTYCSISRYYKVSASHTEQGDVYHLFIIFITLLGSYLTIHNIPYMQD